MSKTIPVDVMFDILSLLPVKPLLRFRCLTKCFCALIDSPGFINFHLNLSVKTSTNRSLILNAGYSLDGSIYRVDLDSFPDNMRPVKLDLHHMRVPLRIFGSCNGLVAMYDDQGITIWNPSTKKQQIVRKFWTGNVLYGGFGYDVKTNDYKVITLSGRVKEKGYYFTVVVYSLKRNTSSRIKDLHTPDPFAYFSRLNFVLVGSSLHWIVIPCKTSRLSSNTILAFDLGNETFSEVPTPPGVDKDYQKLRSMAELGGCLSVNDVHTNGYDVDIWIMKEYGVKESWTKLFSLSINKHQGFRKFSNWKPLCYIEKGDKVLMDCEYGRFHVLYDLKEQSVQRIDLFDLGYWDGFLCVRSLVPLNVEAKSDVRFLMDTSNHKKKNMRK